MVKMLEEMKNPKQEIFKQNKQLLNLQNYLILSFFNFQVYFKLFFFVLFSFAEFPAELQLQLMEEDNNLPFGDEIQPDEQQMEVLEDIWLKAGEIGTAL